MDYTKVDLERLKAVVCRLIDELARKTGSGTYQLPEEDFYWIIPAELKMVRDGRRPSEFHVGRLRDDWELTQSIADVPMDQIMTAYALTEVAPLLEYMGHSMVTSSPDLRRIDDP